MRADHRAIHGVTDPCAGDTSHFVKRESLCARRASHDAVASGTNDAIERCHRACIVVTRIQKEFDREWIERIACVKSERATERSRGVTGDCPGRGASLLKRMVRSARNEERAKEKTTVDARKGTLDRTCGVYRGSYPEGDRFRVGFTLFDDDLLFDGLETFAHNLELVLSRGCTSLKRSRGTYDSIVEKYGPLAIVCRDLYGS